MRALVLTRYGGPEAVAEREVPEPVPGPREVLVRVWAGGLNPLDYKIRQGKLRVIRRFPLPLVIGNELSGTVVRLGDGVTKFAIGDRVYARVDKDQLGAFGELASVSEDLVAKAPSSIGLDEAAAVPLAALTALQALRDVLGVQRGDKVFIPGGAGGVGTFAIQLAKGMGAEVATTASPRGDALVRRLGADVVIDYTSQRFQDALSGYDSAFDLLGGDTLLGAFAVVRRGGTVVSVAGVPEPQTAHDLGRGRALAALFWLASFKIRRRARPFGVRYRYMFMRPSGADLAFLAREIDAQRLEVVVDRVFPFEKAHEALAYLEAGRAKGKVVLRMTSE